MSVGGDGRPVCLDGTGASDDPRRARRCPPGHRPGGPNRKDIRRSAQNGRWRTTGRSGDRLRRLSDGPSHRRAEVPVRRSTRPVVVVRSVGPRKLRPLGRPAKQGPRRSVVGHGAAPRRPRPAGPPALPRGCVGALPPHDTAARRVTAPSHDAGPRLGTPPVRRSTAEGAASSGRSATPPFTGPPVDHVGPLHDPAVRRSSTGVAVLLGRRATARCCRFACRPGG